MSTVVVSALLFGISCFGAEPLQRADLVKLVDQFAAANHESAVVVKDWPARLKATSIEVELVTDRKCEPGTCFGATASQLLDVPFDQFKQMWNQGQNICKVAQRVRTQKVLNCEVAADQTVAMNLLIDVPVLPDIRTDVTGSNRIDGEQRLIFVWQQRNDSGELNYTQGAMVLEPNRTSRAQTRVSIIGVHWIKPEHKIMWLARGPARDFAKNHYGNFIHGLLEEARHR